MKYLSIREGNIITILLMANLIVLKITAYIRLFHDK